MAHLGDFRTGKVVRFTFTTVTTTGAPTQLAGTPAVSVYKDASTTQSTTGVTLTVDFDSVTGLNHVAVDTSADGTFYSAGSDFSVVITAGTVGGTSAVGYTVGSFSLENRSALMPTTDGRKLDVSAGGEAGVDWANVGSPTTTLNLSGTTVKTATDVETDTADIQSRLPAALGANGNIKADVRDFNGTAGTFASGRPEVNTTHAAGTAWGSGAITAASIAADAITAAKIADGAIDAATFAAGAINAAAIADGAIDRATFAAETGLQTVRSNTAQAGAASAITLDASASATNDVYNDLLIYLTGGTGAGQAAWITDYVGATKVATVKPAWVTTPDATTTFAILPAASVWHQVMADHVVSGSTGASLNAAGGAGDPWTTSLPGAYGAGTAGYIVGTYLDAAVTSRLAPTTSGRTLDVTATGAAGIDWGNVENPTTVVGLSGTTVKTATDVETDTADIQSRLPAALVSGRMDASVGAYQTGLTPLQPTVAGRTLDVTATGEAGIDWANIGGATTTVNLSGTTVKAVTDNVNAVLANAAQGGAAAVLTLERIVVASATTNEPAVKFTGNGTGAGFAASGGATGPGFQAVGGGTSGNGITVTTTDGHAVFLDATGSGKLSLSAAEGVTFGGTFTVNALTVTNALTAGSNAIPWNASWDAEVQSEAEDALVAHRLDELLNADSDIDGAAPPTVGSVVHELMSKTAGSFTYDQTTDSLEALRDRGDAAWTTATGFSTLDAAGVRSAVGLATANLDTQLGTIDTNVDSILADTGTDGVVVAAASKSGYALSATGLDAVAVTDPGAPGSHNTLPKMLVGLWRWFYKKTTLTSTQLKTYADDGSTVNGTATVSDDGTTQTKGALS